MIRFLCLGAGIAGLALAGASVTPAAASLALNALTSNGLSATGAAVGDLNGVRVEGVVLPANPSR